MSNVFESDHPLVAHKLTKLRDINTDPKKFRELVRELAGLLAYEATRDLATQPKTVTTPMGEALATDRVSIPMPGRAESLNAAMAGGILIAEVLRQRYSKKKA